MKEFFKLKENGTSIRTEVLGGLTTFLAMAYILAVNPAILSTTGMNPQALLMATALAAFVGTLCMGLMANYPFALAPGLGLNAFFAFTVCGIYGYSWQLALLAVFAEGVIFIILTLTPIRERIFDAIPYQIKKGVAAGLGLFIAFIGLQNAKIVVLDESTLVGLVPFKGESFSTTGICAVLAMVGFLIMVVLHIFKIKGSIIIGILCTWGLGILAEKAGVYTGPSLLPSWEPMDFTAMGQTFGACFSSEALGNFKVFDFIVIVLSFLFIDIFDTIGGLVGCADKGGLLDKQGRLPRLKPALMADAIATTVGAVFGTSTTTTFAESSSGIAVGARTGLSSVVTGFLFLISMIIGPVFISIPGFATAPALIMVGILMLESIKDIEFRDPRIFIPTIITIIAMPLFYSVSDGIAAGIISHVAINLFTGKGKTVSPIMYALAVLFILKYIFI